MRYWHEGARSWMMVGGALTFLFWAGVIGLVVWGIARLTRHSHNDSGALAVARERYARGEISKEEFDRIQKDLS